MSRQLKEFIQRWIITTVAVLVATFILKPKIDYDNWQALLVATLLLGLLNAFIKPVLLLLSLPLLLFTLGFFTLVINALLLFFVGQLIQGFHVSSFGAAFLGALIISLVSVALNSLTGSGNARIRVERGKAPPKRRPPDDGGDGGGPVIDV